MLQKLLLALVEYARDSTIGQTGWQNRGNHSSTIILLDLAGWPCVGSILGTARAIMSPKITTKQ
jgi:hypothetical protein